MGYLDEHFEYANWFDFYCVMRQTDDIQVSQYAWETMERFSPTQSDGNDCYVDGMDLSSYQCKTEPTTYYGYYKKVLKHIDDSPEIAIESFGHSIVLLANEISSGKKNVLFRDAPFNFYLRRFLMDMINCLSKTGNRWNHESYWILSLLVKISPYDWMIYRDFRYLLSRKELYLEEDVDEEMFELGKKMKENLKDDYSLLHADSMIASYQTKYDMGIYRKSCLEDIENFGRLLDYYTHEDDLDDMKNELRILLLSCKIHREFNDEL